MNTLYNNRICNSGQVIWRNGDWKHNEQLKRSLQELDLMAAFCGPLNTEENDRLLLMSRRADIPVTEHFRRQLLKTVHQQFHLKTEAL
ncbi:MAG: hypothetical protein ACOX88_08080 [Christensenellales bacterium]|jgi:hypothetical protein